MDFYGWQVADIQCYAAFGAKQLAVFRKGEISD